MQTRDPEWHDVFGFQEEADEPRSPGRREAWSLARGIHGQSLLLRGSSARVLRELKVFLAGFPEIAPPPESHEADLHIDFVEHFTLSKETPSVLLYDGTIYLDIPIQYRQTGELLEITTNHVGVARAIPTTGQAEITIADEARFPPFYIATRLFYPTLCELLRARGRYVIHASLVAHNGMAILLPGKSQSGKTRLALGLVKLGAKFMSDDMAILERTSEAGLQLLSWPRTVHVHEKTLEFLKGCDQIRQVPVPKGLEKRPVAIQEFTSGDATIDRARPSLIVFPRFSEQRPYARIPLSPMESLRRLLPNSLFVVDQEVARSHFEILVEFTQLTQAFEVEFGRDFEELRELLSCVT
jgi:hypothetical protein